MTPRTKQRDSLTVLWLVGCFCFVLFFLDRLSCNPGWLQIRDPPASGSLVLGLQVHIHTPSSPVLSEVMIHTLVHLTWFLIIHLGDHQLGNALPTGKGTERTEIWTPGCLPRNDVCKGLGMLESVWCWEVLACVWCQAVGEGLEKTSSVAMRMEKRNPGLEAGKFQPELCGSWPH